MVLANMKNRTQTVCVKASPSIALIKYWGKKQGKMNLPATSSLAITVTGLYSKVIVSKNLNKKDELIIDDHLVPPSRHLEFFNFVRKSLSNNYYYLAKAENNFPVAAGLASSSSVFAALSSGCALIAGEEANKTKISTMARVGSASAARAVWGGYTVLKAGAEFAYQLYGKEYWSNLRILIVITSKVPKAISSREAMLLVSKTSPFYNAWVKSSGKIFRSAIEALANKNLSQLGELMRTSYMKMMGTMYGADPPINYFQPESIKVLRVVDHLRSSGIQVWETMDAGPQVKIVCMAKDIDKIRESILIETNVESDDIIEASVGEGPVWA